MNIHHILQTCMMITGGGGIPSLSVHAQTVDTRPYLFSSIGLGTRLPWNLLNIHEEITALVRKISHKSDDTPSSEEIPSGVQQPTSHTNKTSPVVPVGMEFQRIVVKAFKEALIKNLQGILKGTLVYLIDSSDQPQFQELSHSCLWAFSFSSQF